MTNSPELSTSPEIKSLDETKLLLTSEVEALKALKVDVMIQPTSTPKTVEKSKEEVCIDDSILGNLKTDLFKNINIPGLPTLENFTRNPHRIVADFLVSTFPGKVSYESKEVNGKIVYTETGLKEATNALKQYINDKEGKTLTINGKIDNDLIKSLIHDSQIPNMFIDNPPTPIIEPERKYKDIKEYLNLPMILNTGPETLKVIGSSIKNGNITFDQFDDEGIRIPYVDGNDDQISLSLDQINDYMKNPKAKRKLSIDENLKLKKDIDNKVQKFQNSLSSKREAEIIGGDPRFKQNGFDTKIKRNQLYNDRANALARGEKSFTSNGKTLYTTGIDFITADKKRVTEKLKDNSSENLLLPQEINGKYKLSGLDIEFKTKQEALKFKEKIETEMSKYAGMGNKDAKFNEKWFTKTKSGGVRMEGPIDSDFLFASRFKEYGIEGKQDTLIKYLNNLKNPDGTSFRLGDIKKNTETRKDLAREILVKDALAKVEMENSYRIKNLGIDKMSDKEAQSMKVLIEGLIKKFAGKSSSGDTKPFEVATLGNVTDIEFNSNGTLIDEVAVISRGNFYGSKALYPSLAKPENRNNFVNYLNSLDCRQPA